MLAALSYATRWSTKDLPLQYGVYADGGATRSAAGVAGAACGRGAGDSPFRSSILSGGGHCRTVQELLGHRDVSTTMIYTHVLNRGGLGVQSPEDRLLSGAGLSDSAACGNVWVVWERVRGMGMKAQYLLGGTSDLFITPRDARSTMPPWPEWWEWESD